MGAERGDGLSALETVVAERCEPTVDRTSFRSLMTLFPSGVAVVTTRGRHGQPVGLTCSSVCSLSLDPPLLLTCISNSSATLTVIRDRSVFAVNFLAHHARDTAEAFASSSQNRFQRVDWAETPVLALPALHQHTLAVSECRVQQMVVAGDHTIVIGLVVGVQVQSHHRVPLLYGMRQYAAWPEAS